METPLNSGTFQRQIGGILIVAIIMTFFEILFFYTQVAPRIGTQIKNALNNITKKISKNYPTTKVPASFVNSLVDEEDKLVQKINRSILFDASVISVPLLITLILLEVNVRNNDDMSIILNGSTWFMVGVSVVFFALFQIYFFCNISFNYKYPYNSELQNTMLSSLITTIDKKLAEPSV